MRSIIKIDGGIGRVICATGAIRRASSEEKVIVITPWPEVFEHNPYVFKTYKDGTTQYLFDDVIKHGDFQCPEPYFSRLYYNQQQHLSESFDHILNPELDREKPKPEIFLTQVELAFGTDVVSKILATSGKRSAIAYQPFGSGAVMTNNGFISDPSFRSLTDRFNRRILSDCTDSVFINLSHIPISHPNCWQQQFNLRQLFSVSAACNAVVSIDSLLSHVGVALEKRGVLILGATYPINVGYDEYSNYKTFQRDGFPKSYQSNRFGGHVEMNEDAMNFDSSEQDRIIESIIRLA